MTRQSKSRSLGVNLLATLVERRNGNAASGEKSSRPSPAIDRSPALTSPESNESFRYSGFTWPVNGVDSVSKFELN
jgi:hypothetical protein